MMQNNIIILYPQENEEIKSVLEYNFKDADLFPIPKNYSPFEREELSKKINKDYKQVFFYDYYDQFYLLLPIISKKIKRKYIISTSIANMANPYFFNNFMQLLEYKERGIIDAIANTSKELTTVFKDVEYLQLDIEKVVVEKNNKDNIAIISYDYEEKCNFYNQIGAIALTDYKNVITYNTMSVTTNFAKDFNLKISAENDIRKMISNSILGMNVSFTDIDSLIFLMFMDNEVPFILGNTSIIDDTKNMKKYLCVSSDDDVNEISDKIKNSINNKNDIFEEYKRWRKDYSKESLKAVKKFIDR